jgi:hypothetical protein
MSVSARQTISIVSPLALMLSHFSTKPRLLSARLFEARFAHSLQKSLTRFGAKAVYTAAILLQKHVSSDFSSPAST